MVHSVEGIEPGVYHYAFESHELDQLQVGDFRAEVARAALDATGSLLSELFVNRLFALVVF